MYNGQFIRKKTEIFTLMPTAGENRIVLFKRIMFDKNGTVVKTPNCGTHKNQNRKMQKKTYIELDLC